jgi:YgiT-type zinc finger domain-containing protein
MIPFDKCPVCGGELEEKAVEKLLRGGNHTVSMRVTAEVCLHCGERLYAEDVVRSFEEIRGKLKKQDFSHFRNLGQSFTIADDWPKSGSRPASRRGGPLRTGRASFPASGSSLSKPR